MSEDRERKADEEPLGWRLDVLSVTPPRVLSGERRFAILGAMFSAIFVLGFGAMAAGGPWFFPVVAFGFFVWFVWMAFAGKAWKIDPMLSRTWPRFNRYPHFIAAHSTGAVPDSVRKAERAREGFRR